MTDKSHPADHNTQTLDISSPFVSQSRKSTAKRQSTHKASPIRLHTGSSLHSQSSNIWTKQKSILKARADAEAAAEGGVDLSIPFLIGEGLSRQATFRMDKQNRVIPKEKSPNSRTSVTKTIDKSFQEKFENSLFSGEPILLFLITSNFMFCLSVLLLSGIFENGNLIIATSGLLVSFTLSIVAFQGLRLFHRLQKSPILAIYLFMIVIISIIIFIQSSKSSIILIFGSSSLFVATNQAQTFRTRTHLLISFTLIGTAYLLKESLIKSDCFNSGHCPNSASNDVGRSFFWISICFVYLVGLVFIDHIIHVNLNEYTIEENDLTRLVDENLELQNQLRVAKIKPEKDIAAPLTRATELLVAFQERNRVHENDSILREVETILGILNSDKLFEPDFFQDTGDNVVTTFLQDVLQTKKITYKATTRTIKTLAKTETRKEKDSELLQLLDNINQPFFNIFKLEVLSGGHALYHIAITAFRNLNFQELIGVPERMFSQWLLKMELGYDRKNPYHNSSHAADVTQVMNYFITRPKLIEILTIEEAFSCIVAAIGHDYMHPGVTNNFLIATRNPLAIRYNDTSVLEHFHASSVAEIFGQSEFDLFPKTSEEQKRYIRELVITMIMATDMSFHFEWLSKFKNKLSTNSFNYENGNDKKLIMNVAMKCSDINNLTRPLVISRIWTQLVIEEFFNQGDQEKARGLPVSMFMDRNNTDIPKCQMSFIDYIVLPLYEAWNGFLPGDVDAHVANIKSNKAFWKEQSESGNAVVPVEMPKYNLVALRIHPSNHQKSNSKSTVTSQSSQSSKAMPSTPGSNGRKRSSFAMGRASFFGESSRPSIILSKIVERISVISRRTSQVYEEKDDLNVEEKSSHLSDTGSLLEESGDNVIPTEHQSISQEDTEEEHHNREKPPTKRAVSADAFISSRKPVLDTESLPVLANDLLSISLLSEGQSTNSSVSYQTANSSVSYQSSNGSAPPDDVLPVRSG